MKAINLFKNGKKIRLPYQTKSLRETSCDTSNGIHMIDSELQVISLDDLARMHAKRFRFAGPLASNDAFYISRGQDYYFIEFKNGSKGGYKPDIETALRKKMEGSIQICDDFGVMPASFPPQNLDYILVYNKQKYVDGQDRIYGGIRARAGECQFQKFNIGSFVGIFCKSAFSYTVEQFTDMFVRPMEQAESLP